MSGIVATLGDVFSKLTLACWPDTMLARLAWHLGQTKPDLVARNVNKPQLDWQKISLPKEISEFHDLAFLFWCNPVNRGVCRLDLDEGMALFGALRGLAPADGSLSGVEIGRWLGGSTVLIAAALPPKSRLLSIDIAPRADDKLNQVLTALNMTHKVDLIVADANEYPPPESLDFAFIDGDHTYEGAKKDHLKWGNLVRPGGLIIHHDMGFGRQFSTQHESLRKLKGEIQVRQSRDVALVAEVGSLVIWQRLGQQWQMF